jgi:hypothetical protein
MLDRTIGSCPTDLAHFLSFIFTCNSFYIASKKGAHSSPWHKIDQPPFNHWTMFLYVEVCWQPNIGLTSLTPDNHWSSFKLNGLPISLRGEKKKNVAILYDFVWLTKSEYRSRLLGCHYKSVREHIKASQHSKKRGRRDDFCPDCWFRTGCLQTNDI